MLKFIKLVFIWYPIPAIYICTMIDLHLPLSDSRFPITPLPWQIKPSSKNLLISLVQHAVGSMKRFIGFKIETNNSVHHKKAFYGRKFMVCASVFSPSFTFPLFFLLEDEFKALSSIFLWAIRRCYLVFFSIVLYNEQIWEVYVVSN